MVEDPEDTEYMGTPRLRAVFNRLKDLEKLVGGSAEMFWRGARPGYAGDLKDDYSSTPETESDMKKQMEEYEHGLRRFLVNEGMTLKSLAPQVSDPKSHVDIQIEMISAKTSIPKRILTGAERGELASTQDNEQWLTLIQNRREEFATEEIVVPFIDKLIDLGLLPKSQEGDYSIQWDDLFAPSIKDKADIGKTRAEALRQYHAEPLAQSTVPPQAFFKFFLGLSEDEIELIEEMMMDEVNEEVRDSRQMEESIDLPEPDEEE